jgi:error-prone DNA polymerase
VDRVAKSSPHTRACDIRAGLAELPELKQLAAKADQFGMLFELAEGLDKLPRGMAIHSCGVNLSNESLLDRLSVQPTPGSDYPMVHADRTMWYSTGSAWSSSMSSEFACSRRWRTP